MLNTKQPDYFQFQHLPNHYKSSTHIKKFLPEQNGCRIPHAGPRPLPPLPLRRLRAQHRQQALDKEAPARRRRLLAHIRCRLHGGHRRRHADRGFPQAVAAAAVLQPKTERQLGVRGHVPEGARRLLQRGGIRRNAEQDAYRRRGSVTETV